MNTYNNITVTWNDPRDRFTFAGKDGFALHFVKNDGVYFSYKDTKVKLDLSLVDKAWFEKPGLLFSGSISFSQKTDDGDEDECDILEVPIDGDKCGVLVHVSKKQKEEFLALTSTISFPGGNIEITVC